MISLVKADRPKISRYRQAIGWLLRLQDPRSSDKDIEEWLRWCDADPQNLQAFEAFQQDWQDVQGLKGEASGPEVTGSMKSASAAAEHLARITAVPRIAGVAQIAGVARIAAVARISLPRTLRLHWKGWAIAAGLSAVVTAVSLQGGRSTEVHRSIGGQAQETALLPDGSSLILSARASADVDYSAGARRLELHPGGEAYVKVHHDRSRPFSVHAGAMTVVAVGTAFDVRRDAADVIVTVEEGTVLASAAGTSGVSEWRAGAGYQLRYSESSHRAQIARIDALQALRWRDGELAYDNAPLETVVADINRYSTVTLRLGDGVGRMPFTGTVFVASVPDWVKALESKYPIEAQREAGGDIVLKAAPATR